MSLLRLLQGHGFFNTATYKIWSEYDVYQISVEWADGSEEEIRCHEYREKPTGLEVRIAHEPYLGSTTKTIHRGYDADRVLVNMEEYTVSKTGETDRVEKTVEMKDIGIITPTTPKLMYSKVAETGYELCEVK